MAANSKSRSYLTESSRSYIDCTLVAENIAIFEPIWKLFLTIEHSDFKNSHKMQIAIP